MDSVLTVLNGLLPVGYLLALLGYLVVFVQEDSWFGRGVTAATWALVGVHGGYLVLSGLVYGHIPTKNTMPVGVRARLSVDAGGAARLAILEPVTEAA